MQPPRMKVSYALVQVVNGDGTLSVTFQQPDAEVQVLPDPGLSLNLRALVTAANGGQYQPGDVVAVLTNHAQSVLLVLGVIQVSASA